MTLVCILFVLGALVLALEIIVPGGVLAVLGGGLMLAGATTAFVKLGATGGIVATLLALLLLGITMYLELVWLPRSHLAKQFSMDTTIDSVSQPPVASAQDVVGREALALSTLAPTGFVEVGGKRYEASCRCGYAASGQKLTVVGIDSFRLIVTKS
jgi:membrane-bound serine protease (ClpP class)